MFALRGRKIRVNILLKENEHKEGRTNKDKNRNY